MNADHEIVLVPRETANDDTGVLVAWLRGDGEHVEAEERICELEFSKAIVEVTAPRSGYLFHLHSQGDEVAVATPLAAVSERPERPSLRSEALPRTAASRTTAKARKLMAQYDVHIEDLEGVPAIKERHVIEYLEHRELSVGGKQARAIHRGDQNQAQEGKLLPLTAVRRRAAMALTESKQTIPHSYVSARVQAEPVKARIESEGCRLDMMISVSAWLVACVAQQAARHPHVNAYWRSDGVFQYARTNIGFALNQDDGDLVVPVLRDADRLSLEELVVRMSGLQKKAVRRKLSIDDLSGGTLTVTSLIGSGAHQVFPIIVPRQAMIVGIADECPFPSPTWSLTAAFDHRVVNGTEAAAFLAAVTENLYRRGEPR